MQTTEQLRKGAAEQALCSSELESVEQALTRLLRLAETRRTSDPAQAPRNRLDRAAYTLLSQLDLCPTARLTELATRLEIDLSTASRQVRVLEDRGFVARLEDPTDQRAAGLELTEAGRQVLSAARALRVERIASRLDSWEQHDVFELARLLSKLVASFTDNSGPPHEVPPAPPTQLEGVSR